MTLHKDTYNKALSEAFKDFTQRRAMDALLGSAATPSGFPVSSIPTVKVDPYVNGQQRIARLTLTNVPQTVVNGVEHQGIKIADWPLGLLRVDACYGRITQTTTSTIATTINSGVTGAFSLGTVTSSATTLSGTMANIAPSTAFVSSTTINVPGSAFFPVLAAPIVINGSVTAMDLFLNSAFATTTDVDADGTQTFSGVIYVVYELLTTGAIV